MQKKGSKSKADKKINLNKDERRSRFVVDLKARLQAAREREMIENSFFSKNNNRLKQWRQVNSDKAESLAIFSFLKLCAKVFSFFWKFFYKLSYYVGWVSIFSVKFIYLFFAGIFKLSAKAILSFFSFLKKHPFKSSSPISGVQDSNDGYQAGYGDPVFTGKFPDFKSVPATFQESHIGTLLEYQNENARPVRQTAIFGLALIILILPLKAMTFYGGFNIDDLKGKVLGATEEGARDFLTASQSITNLDLTKATNDFSDAGDNFLQARNEVNEISGLLSAVALFMPDKKIRLASEAEPILSAAESASDLGNNISLAINELIGGKDKKRELKDMLEGFIVYGDKAVGNADLMKEGLGRVNIDNLPAEYREKFSFVSDKATMLAGSLREFVNLAKSLKNFLGFSLDKRYLLVFQNNAELRATGGFIGSFAIIDFRDGKIKNIEAPVGGSYDTEAGLKVNVTAPEPLHLVNPLWHFWDANWWPDWTASARKLEWFYEKSDGSTVDGVISFTPTVLEKILEIIGPVDMTEKYGVILTADNLWLTLQRFAEQKPDVTKEPKKIIGDLIFKLLEELPKRLDQKNLIALLRATQENLDSKQVLFYFNDADLEKKIIDYGWGGAMNKTAGDYLSVINTNIAGGKSDRKIVEKIYHEADISEDGSIMDSLKIERTHAGVKREEFTGVRNVNWMRIYVPLGSKLISAGGFVRPDDKFFSQPDASWQTDEDVYRSEAMARTDGASGTKIYEENGYTVFANWSMVDPGETTTINLKYSLPFKLKKDGDDRFWAGRLKNSLNFKTTSIEAYSLLVQKQAGATQSYFESNLKLNGELGPFWNYPKNINATGDGWLVKDSLDKDKYWAVLMERSLDL